MELAQKEKRQPIKSFISKLLGHSSITQSITITTDDLEKLCEDYQKALEQTSSNYPSGTCYMAGYCISKFLLERKIPARSVSGSLALIDKNGKYIVYGNHKLNGTNVGLYHTWCEAMIDGKLYIIDPSLKYNIFYLKKMRGIKISSKVPPYLITTEKQTYNWKYIEDEKLKNHSDYFLKLMKQISDDMYSSLSINFEIDRD